MASATATKEKAPKVAKKIDPAKLAKRNALKAKRTAKLNELREKEPIKFAALVTYKEAKELGVAATWQAFCEMKAKAYSDYWMQRAAKPVTNPKVLERKMARYEKIKKMLAELEGQIGKTSA